MPSPRKNQSNVPKEKQYSVGSNLQMLRVQRGITQQELADHIGVTRQALGAYEADKVAIPSPTLIDIALTLGVSADEILGLKPIPKTSQVFSLRLTKRMAVIDDLPEPQKKHVCKLLDQIIKANKQ